jgi:hypothetical protein
VFDLVEPGIQLALMCCGSGFAWFDALVLSTVLAPQRIAQHNDVYRRHVPVVTALLATIRPSLADLERVAPLYDRFDGPLAPLRTAFSVLFVRRLQEQVVIRQCFLAAALTADDGYVQLVSLAGFDR